MTHAGANSSSAAQLGQVVRGTLLAILFIIVLWIICGTTVVLGQMDHFDLTHVPTLDELAPGSPSVQAFMAPGVFALTHKLLSAFVTIGALIACIILGRKK